MERFVAYLTEEYKGAFPFWLAPIQVRVLPVNNKIHADYAQTIHDELRRKGYRVETDMREEKLGYKVRDAQTQKIPYLLVIGDQEQDSRSVTYRSYNSEKQVTVPFQEFLDKIARETKNNIK